MSKVIAIIDSAFGDSGKGLMTDYYSSQYGDEAVVIRSNGGAQAGHTVVTPDGKRHVFSHFGSGSFNGTPTYLSKHFVGNPALFVKEYKLFVEQFGACIPTIYVDPRSIFSTPYDMLLNQKQETMRGDGIHGSCGVGFGETYERQLSHHVHNMAWLDEIYHLTPSQFDKYIFKYLDDIRRGYVPTRIDVEQVSTAFIELLNDDVVIENFINDCRFMMEHVTLAGPRYFRDDVLIFEAAQGLLLDMDYGYFPHVTRSNCGMKNISDILCDIPGEHNITANYVTRAYTTRHGAGPLDREDPSIFDRHNIVDQTNITNEWQGTLRAAPLNLDLFQSITDKDFLNYAPRSAKKITTITCLDQLEGECTWIAYNQPRYMDAGVVRSRAREKFDVCSFGPTRNDVKIFDK